MLYRNQIRAVFSSAEVTSKLLSITSDSLAFALTTSQSLLVGLHERFASRYFVMGVVNTVSTSVLTVEYWNGTDWTAVSDLTDDTAGMTLKVAQVRVK